METVSLAPGLHLLPMVYELDGRVVSHPLEARGFASNNAYLYSEPDGALLLRTGYPVHGEALLAAIEGLLGREASFSVWNVEVGEFCCCGNIRALAERFEVENLYSPMEDSAIWGEFRPEEVPFGTPPGLGAMAEVREMRVGRGEFVAVGSGARRLKVLEAPLRLLPTNWVYDERNKALFTSDAFGHLWQPTPDGPWVVSGEQAEVDLERTWEYLAGARFWWLAGARTDLIRAQIEATFSDHEVELIAPSSGCVIAGREAVARHVQAFDDLLAAAPSRAPVAFAGRSRAGVDG